MTIESKAISRRGLLGGIALLGATGCGYLLYPQRRGRNGGEIDGLVLLVDILWLLPGLVPGIICLAVDFSTGCIYGREGRRVIITADAVKDIDVEIHVDGVVRAKGEVKPDGQMHLIWSGNDTPDLETLRERGRIVATSLGDARAEAHLRELI